MRSARKRGRSITEGSAAPVDTVAAITAAAAGSSSSSERISSDRSSGSGSSNSSRRRTQDRAHIIWGFVEGGKSVRGRESKILG